MRNIDNEFANKIIELENGWIETPHGIFTPNDVTGQNAYEVYEGHMHDLENPPAPKPSLEDTVKEQLEVIEKLLFENESLKDTIESGRIVQSRLNLVNRYNADKNSPDSNPSLPSIGIPVNTDNDLYTVLEFNASKNKEELGERYLTEVTEFYLIKYCITFDMYSELMRMLS